jgi:DNA repair protein RecN (Recombination protein N)
MLQEINLHNFVLIEQLDLSLASGMTVITGETGAGKSIIIDAVELALGHRLENKVVREGHERCDINLCFNIKNNSFAQSWLQERELLDDNMECVIRRTITQDGKSRCYINGQPMTLQNLAELGSYLLNIHGQHQHQTLLKREQQRQIVDEYAGHLDLVIKVKNFYHQWHELTEKINQLQSLNQERISRRDYLNYQLAEFSKVALSENELANLNKQHQLFANADTIITQAQQTLSLLTEAEQANAIDLLQASLQILNGKNTTNSSFNNITTLIENALIQLEEARNELQHYVNHTDNDPQQLQQIEQRLSVLHDLARKHRVQPEELYALQMQLQNELTSIDNFDEDLKQLKTQLAKVEQEYFIAANELSKKRQQASNELSKSITKNMQELGLSGGKFQIELTTDNNKPQLTGLEKVEFLVSANPGQLLQPLNKVASGGELSRISLAIQVIIAKKISTPTLIFDEVDVGIGGKIAEIVGRKLRELGTNAQVLCITHQPQVAALGHHHLNVAKTTDKKITHTKIEQLDQHERINEIARMLGGINITEQTLAHAKEILTTANA